MARPLRLEHEGALWHVTSRGNEQKDIYRDDEDRRKFLALLEEAAERYRWVVHVYTLMDNHFHLMFETPEKTLSRGMQWLNGKYARYFNKRYRRFVAGRPSHRRGCTFTVAPGRTGAAGPYGSGR